MEHNASRAASLAHVNLMVDTTIANFEPNALRSIMRSMLASDKNGDITRCLTTETQKFFRNSLQRTKSPQFFAKTPLTPCSNSPTRSWIMPTPALTAYRKKGLAFLGCSLEFESLDIFAEIVDQANNALASEPATFPLTCAVSSTGFNYGGDSNDDPMNGHDENDELYDALVEVDSEIVQALTAVQKIVTGNGGMRQQITEAQESADPPESHDVGGVRLRLSDTEPQHHIRAQDSIVFQDLPLTVQV
ncbi:hypothetical protein KEM56_001091 [Ascosphaera pollenicola]|nr:hypothetical protein KEM56_001091 [Ascosphaera pollenicola]